MEWRGGEIEISIISSIHLCECTNELEVGGSPRFVILVFVVVLGMFSHS